MSSGPQTEECTDCLNLSESTLSDPSPLPSIGGFRASPLDAVGSLQGHFRVFLQHFYNKPDIIVCSKTFTSPPLLQLTAFCFMWKIKKKSFQQSLCHFSLLGHTWKMRLFSCKLVPVSVVPLNWRFINWKWTSDRMCFLKKPRTNQKNGPPAHSPFSALEDLDCELSKITGMFSGW